MQINYNQIKLIHVARRELGLDSDSYKDVLMQFGGVETSKNLTLEAFQEVMTYFESCGFKKAQGSRLKAQSRYSQYFEKWEKLGHRPQMATAKQLARIETDWDALKWYWNKDGHGDRDAALKGLLLARFACEDLRFLGFGAAGGMIEALKGIKKRRERLEAEGCRLER